MAKSKRTCDVFISHAAGDAKLASKAASACRANGLDAITDTDLLPTKNQGDALWDALAEMRALLAILSPAGPTASMAIEIGAARAWNKPIYGIVSDPSIYHLPLSELKAVKLYAIGKVQDVINAIKFSNQELSDDDRSFLMKLYGESRVSVDQLALEPRELGRLVKKFNDHRGKTVSGERLLSELLRMRKQGKLTLNRPRARLSSPSDSA